MRDIFWIANKLIQFLYSYIHNYCLMHLLSVNFEYFKFVGEKFLRGYFHAAPISFADASRGLNCTRVTNSQMPNLLKQQPHMFFFWRARVISIENAQTLSHPTLQLAPPASPLYMLDSRKNHTFFTVFGTFVEIYACSLFFEFGLLLPSKYTCLQSVPPVLIDPNVRVIRLVHMYMSITQL